MLDEKTAKKMLAKAYEYRNQAEAVKNLNAENFYRGQICVLRNLLMTDEQKSAVSKKARQGGQHSIIRTHYPAEEQE